MPMSPPSPPSPKPTVAIVLTLLALLAASCSSAGRGEGTAAADEVRSDVARAAVPVDQAGPAVRGTNGLASALYRKAIETETGNLVFSPYSIEVALAMARVGANGETRAEMDRVLGAAAGDELDRSLNALDAALASRNGERGEGERTGEVNLRTANALWGQRDLTFGAPFLEVLGREYGAGINVVDYKTDSEGARKRINTWTSERTNGKIPELIPPGVLDAATRLVLTNAVWFKAPWATPFDLVPDAPFRKGDGTTAPVKTMTGGAGGRYGSGAGWKAATIPYLGNELEMVVIVPDDLHLFEESFTATTLDTINGGLTRSLDSLTMPTFEYRTTLPLKEQLIALGMPIAFTDAADFSGITTQVPLVITDVLHQAFIAVDEQGTEAAAATAVVFAETSAPAESNRLVVDRPFLYEIRDQKTGAVLFLGRVTDPSATSE